MKRMLIVGALVVLASGLIYLISQSQQTNVISVQEQNNVTDDTNMQPAPPPGKLRANMFSGTLQNVDTGCFADGECYAEVDGKKVTILMGWSTSTVGSIIGTDDGIGGLESHIGQEVEVYAQDNADGTYSLYGSEGFYIKVN